MTVLRGRVFFAESITHGAFPGAVIGVVGASVFTRDHSILALCVFLGALGLCLPLSALMSALARIPGVSGGAAAGVVLTFSFALGYFLSKWFAPLPLQISSFLTGSIMTVTPMDIALAATATLGALALLALRGRHILLLSFDEQGYRAAFRSSPGACALTDALISALITVCVIVMIPAVGTLLPLALLIAPSAGLMRFISRPGVLMAASACAALAVCACGFGISLIAELSSGGCIALASGLFFCGCVAWEALASRPKAGSTPAQRRAIRQRSEA
jgi:ABC-type mn2+/zn2+ transporter, permease component